MNGVGCSMTITMTTTTTTSAEDRGRLARAPKVYGTVFWLRTYTFGDEPARPSSQAWLLMSVSIDSPDCFDHRLNTALVMAAAA